MNRYSLYGHDLTLRDLYVSALKGLVSSLDEYSAFLGPDDVQRIEAHQLGVSWGIGVHLVKPARDEPLVVAKPYVGGPTFHAGLRTGDQILEVNGVTTDNHDLRQIKQVTAGSEGNVVQLLVRGWDSWER